MSEHALPLELPSPSLSTLCSQSIGPLENCRDAVWQQLSDFVQWQQWSTAIEKVERLDKGDIGRGSVLSVKSGSTVRQWQIVYWHPATRVDFEIQTKGYRIGYSFFFSEAGDDKHVELQLSIEFEFIGIHRLYASFLRYQERRTAEQLFKEFIFQLKVPPTQHP